MIFRRAFCVLVGQLGSRLGMGLVAGVLAGLTSCMEHPTTTPEGLARRGLRPGEGLIVGTFDVKTVDSYGDPYSIRTNIARVLAKSEDGRMVEMSPTQLGDHRGPFAVPVPAGNYEIIKWHLTSMDRPDALRIMNDGPLKVPFRVTAGEAVYVGRMNAFFRYSKALIGVQVLSDGFIQASDHYVEDVARVRRDYPMVRGMKVTKSDVPVKYRAESTRAGVRTH